MLRKIVLVFSFLLVTVTAFAGSLPPQTLIKGQSTTLDVDYEIGDVAVTDQSVCDYVVQENRRQIYLNPKKEGRISLTLWDVSGTKQDTVPISIISVGLNEILEDAKATFGSSGNLKFFIQGEQVIIRGEVASPADIARIQAFTSQFPQVKNEARLATAVLDTISSEIEKAIATPGIRIRSVRDKLLLEGTAYSQEASARAEKIAKLYDENIINLIMVKDTKRNPGAEKIIQLDIQFMEIKKTALRTFGINWAPGSLPQGGGGGASAGGAPTDAGGLGQSMLGGIVQQVVGFAFNLIPKIKFARQKGDARVLENPSFLVKSGETADFFSGTQVPFYSQQAVVFKDVGIKIQAEPIASAEDVDLKINVTVTSPTAGGVNKGIDTNTISTTAYCKSGASLALAGIFRNSDAKMYNRIPEDMNTSSAIFTLFLSKDFLSNRSEFIIFVTPRLIDQPAGQSNITTLEKENWDEINENIMYKRSKKEYREYMKQKRGVASESKIKEKTEKEEKLTHAKKTNPAEEPDNKKEPVEENMAEKNEKVKEKTAERVNPVQFELPESLKN